MKLQQLFAIFPRIPEHVHLQTEITGIFADARKVQKDSLFVAVRGTQNDGHQFLPQAVQAGAVALVVEDLKHVPSDFAGLVLKVVNSREVLDLLAARFYQNPGHELFCVGVTGTNGKTSITYMIEHLLNATHVPTGVIGTINHHLQDKIWPSEMTTPDPVSLQKRLREMRDAGAKAVAMEVSSHALDQHRADSVPFNTVIFSNLTRDHLDYHKTMSAYFAAKQKLFTDLLWRSIKRPVYAIINVDDKYGRRMKVADPAIIWTYGHKNADLTFKVKKMTFTQTQFDFHSPAGSALVTLPMSGVHNVQNAVAALGAALSLEIPLAAAVQALQSFAGVPGRLQSVANNKERAVFVDYAHTPDALENVLLSLQSVRKSMRSKAKIWTVFGCGGDRDKGKRPLMAKAALDHSDFVVITSDNPRSESAQAIIDDICAGVKGAHKNKVHIEVERQQAIQWALTQAQNGDVILIAGKGHEDYQIIGNEKINFSDVQVAQQVLETL